MTIKEVSEQKFNAIMSKAIRLDRCPLCGESAEIVISLPWYGVEGAKVRCSKCGYSTKLFNIHSHFNYAETKQLGTPIIEKSLMIGIRSAIQSWNRKGVNNAE